MAESELTGKLRASGVISELKAALSVLRSLETMGYHGTEKERSCVVAAREHVAMAVAEVYELIGGD